MMTRIVSLVLQDVSPPICDNDVLLYNCTVAYPQNFRYL